MPMEYVPIYPTKNQQAKLPKNGALRGARDVGITRDLSGFMMTSLMMQVELCVQLVACRVHV